MSGFRGYDAWLTTDRLAEAHERAAERLIAQWEAFCDWYSEGDAFLASSLPFDACEDDHPDHPIYQAFEALMAEIDAREARLEAEAEVAMLEQEAEYARQQEEL